MMKLVGTLGLSRVERDTVIFAHLQKREGIPLDVASKPSHETRGLESR